MLVLYSVDCSVICGYLFFFPRPCPDAIGTADSVILIGDVRRQCR
jgi:hypothetical protein